MKNIIVSKKTTFILTLVLLISTSCNKDWLDPQPLSLFTPENIFVNEAGFKSALASCATNLRDEWYGCLLYTSYQ